MRDPSAPQILSADKIDNAVVVEFEDEPEPVIYPAELLYAVKDAARAMYAKNLEEGESGTTPGSSA